MHNPRTEPDKVYPGIDVITKSSRRTISGMWESASDLRAVFVTGSDGTSVVFIFSWTATALLACCGYDPNGCHMCWPCVHACCSLAVHSASGRILMSRLLLWSNLYAAWPCLHTYGAPSCCASCSCSLLTCTDDRIWIDSFVLDTAICGHHIYIQAPASVGGDQPMIGCISCIILLHLSRFASISDADSDVTTVAARVGLLTGPLASWISKSRTERPVWSYDQRCILLATSQLLILHTCETITAGLGAPRGVISPGPQPGTLPYI